MHNSYHCLVVPWDTRPKNVPVLQWNTQYGTSLLELEKVNRLENIKNPVTFAQVYNIAAEALAAVYLALRIIYFLTDSDGNDRLDDAHRHRGGSCHGLRVPLFMPTVHATPSKTNTWRCCPLRKKMGCHRALLVQSRNTSSPHRADTMKTIFGTTRC